MLVVYFEDGLTGKGICLWCNLSATLRVFRCRLFH